MLSDCILELLIFMKQGKSRTLFQSKNLILAHSASYTVCPASLVVLDARREVFHDLLLRIGSPKPTFSPCLRIDLSPVWKDTTSVAETSGIAEFPSEFLTDACAGFGLKTSRSYGRVNETKSQVRECARVY